jgi:hypothetical protein
MAIGKKVTGGTVAAAIFRDFNSSYYKVHKMPNAELLAKSGSVKQSDEKLRAQQKTERKTPPTPSAHPPQKQWTPQALPQPQLQALPLPKLQPQSGVFESQTKPQPQIQPQSQQQPQPQPQLQTQLPVQPVKEEPVLTDGKGGLRATAKALTLPAVAKPKRPTPPRRKTNKNRRAYQTNYPAVRPAAQAFSHPAGGAVVRAERGLREFHWR